MQNDTPARYIDRLPTELYPIVIDHIGPDLISHVYFSRLNPRIASCYVGLGRAFWEPVLRESGLGSLAVESTAMLDEDWETVAVQCAEHVVSCQHPACGMGRLRANGMSCYNTMTHWHG